MKMIKPNQPVHSAFCVIASLTLLGCTVSRDATQVSDYNRFAIKAAEVGLWNEAIFRWKQVLVIDAENSKAYNNLGVAYEALGETEEAVSCYQRAAEIAPDNQYYRLNYRRCRIHIRRSQKVDGDEDVPPPRKGTFP